MTQPGKVSCPHPIENIEATTDTIRNCPAEGFPDEQVPAIRCRQCRETVVRTTEGVVEVLLDHIRRLSDEVRELRERTT